MYQVAMATRAGARSVRRVSGARTLERRTTLKRRRNPQKRGRTFERDDVTVGYVTCGLGEKILASPPMKNFGEPPQNNYQVLTMASYVYMDDSYVYMDDSYVNMDDAYVNMDDSYVYMDDSYVYMDDSYV